MAISLRQAGTHGHRGNLTVGGTSNLELQPNYAFYWAYEPRVLTENDSFGSYDPKVQVSSEWLGADMHRSRGSTVYISNVSYPARRVKSLDARFWLSCQTKEILTLPDPRQLLAWRFQGPRAT